MKKQQTVDIHLHLKLMDMKWFLHLHCAIGIIAERTHPNVLQLYGFLQTKKIKHSCLDTACHFRQNFVFKHK